MNNQYFYQPQIIFTRLKDIFNNEANEDNDDFSSENFIKPITIKKALEEKEKKIEAKTNNNLTDEKKKYINKELVECWIEAIKSSK